MSDKFNLGDPVQPSAEGLKVFRNWRDRQGTIIGRCRETRVWEVRWFGRPKTELIHEDFLALSTVRRTQLERLDEEHAEAD